MSITVYFADAASLTLTQASTLYSAAGTPTTTNHNTTIGTATGWSEVRAGGTSNPWSAGGSAPAPDKFGFLWDVTTLENQTMLAGIYSATVRLNTAGTGAGTVTADIHCRAYKYSNGTFSLMADMVASAQSITTTTTNFTCSAVTSSSTSFAVGDKLYIDIVLNVSANTGGAAETIKLSGISTDSTGLTGSTNGQVVTPGTTAIGAPSTNAYGSGLDSGGTPNAAGALYSTSNTRLAIQDSGAKRVRWQIEWWSIERAVQTTSSTTVATGSHTITLATLPSGWTSGMSLLIDATGNTQETVTGVTISGTSLTATFAHAHSGTYPIAAIPGLGTNARPGTDAAVAAYDWSTFDDFVSQCNTDGTFVHFVLQNPPVWHATTLAIDAGKTVPIATDAATFATAVMTRAYTTLGVPIGAFEVANEGFNTGSLTASNVASFFNQMYTYVSAVRTAVKAVSATTLIGAPAELNNNTAVVNVYTAGFFTAYSNPAISTLVDYCNFHCYPAGAPDAPAAGKEGFSAWLSAWQSGMNAAGVVLPVYVTEWGWTFNVVGDTNYNAYLSTVINDAIASGIVQAVLIYNLDQIVPGKHFNDTSTTNTYKTWKNFIANTPQFISGSALTVYLTNSASPTLTTADQLYSQAGSPSTTSTTTTLATGTGFGEIASQGASLAWAGAPSIPSPTGKGWFWNNTSLESQQTIPGQWSGTFTLKTAGTGAVTITANMHARAFRYTPSTGVYTQIAHMTLSGQSITTSAQQFVMIDAPKSSVAFAVGDRLYIDVWLRVVSNTGASTQTVQISFLSTDTSGFTGNVNAQIVTPGYQPSTSGGGGGSSTTGYSVQINGSPVYVVAGTLQVSNTIGKRASAMFQVHSDTSAHFQQYAQVAVYDQNNVLAFSGYITQSKEYQPGFQSSLLHDITCTDQHWLADKRVYAAIYTTPKPASFIVQDIVNNILASEGVTVGQIFDGPLPNTALYPGVTLYPNGADAFIPAATFAYASAAQSLDALAKATTTSGLPYYWMIDQNAALWFLPYYSITNNTLIDGTQIDNGAASGTIPYVLRANPTYRNTQYVTGGVAQTVQQVETPYTNGAIRSWALGYQVAAQPKVTINGSNQTVALKGSSGADFYYAVGDPIITQDPSQSVLLVTDTLQVTYIGQYQAVFSDQNAAQITYQAFVDNSSGIVESVDQDNTIANASNGLATASGLLTRYAAQGVLLYFATLASGFGPGQLLNVNLPKFGINNGQFLIESVDAADMRDSYNIWYKVSALQGPYDITWVDFFSKLLYPNPVLNAINVGVTTSVVLLSSFVAALSPSGTLTTSSFSCPLPSTSLDPSTTLYPC